MLFPKKYAYLTFRKDYAGGHGIGLRGVDGNPLAVRESSDRSHPHLSLVWSQGSILVKKNERATPQPSPLPSHGKAWHWFNENAAVLQAIGAIVASVAVVIGVLWWFFSVSSRVGQVEEKLTRLENGLVEISAGIGKINERAIKLEGKFESFEKYVLPHFADQIYKPKALELGFTDPQIVPLELVKSSEIPLTDRGKSYTLTFSLTEVGKDEMKFLISGTVGNVFINKVTVRVPKQIGVPINLMEVIRNVTPVPLTPGLWVVILDFPRADTAIFAFGPRTV